MGRLVQRVLEAHPSTAKTAKALLKDWKIVYVRHKLLQKLQRIVEDWDAALELSVPQGHATVRSCIREFLVRVLINYVVGVLVHASE